MRYIICQQPEGAVIPVPDRNEIFAEMASKFVCRNSNCKKIWGINLSLEYLSDARCPHCGADIEGKVYPKKRETPREVKQVEVLNNPELDAAIERIIQDNPKVVGDYKSGKKTAVGFLVGQVMKSNLETKPNPAEVKIRLEKSLDTF